MEFKRILIPVAGTEADDETMRLGCRLAKKDKGRIWSVYVVTIKRSLPLDAEIESETRSAEDILDHIEQVAEEENFEIETEIIQSREAGPAIIEEAAEHDVNVIIMGVKYKTHFGQFDLGNVLPYVLKHAPCPVILYHL